MYWSYMLESVGITEILDARGVILDVRSEDEFFDAHIPSALSFPIFTVAERAEVGTLYKQVGADQARLKGLEIFKPKLEYFPQKIFEFAEILAEFKSLQPEIKEKLLSFVAEQL